MKYILITTSVCQKCPPFKTLMQEQNIIPGEIIDEKHPEFSTLIGKYKLSQAPSFIVLNQDESIEFQTNDIGEAEHFLYKHS